MAKKKDVSRVKQTILAVSIAIIFTFFIGFGIETFYESPQYGDYCEEYARPVQLEGENVTDIKEDTCWDEFDIARQPYERNVFIITLILGLAAVIVGGLFLTVESVGSGIMGGGVLTLIYGILRYWGDMSKYLRFAVLGLVLAILIWIGYKKFKK